MGRRSRPAARRAALVMLAGLLAGGCTGPPAGPRTVLQMMDPEFKITGSVKIDAITNVGVPLFANLTNSTVRLLSVRLVDLPPAVHILGVHAYSSRGLGFGQIPFEMGSLPLECPKFFGHPRPVTAVTVRPKGNVNWILTVMLRVSKRTRIHFGRAKITYTIDGTRGWQYQNLNLTLYFEPPHDRRLRIEPKSSVCERPGAD